MLYDNLPGIQLTIKDGNLVLPAEDISTKRVLIIAPTVKEMVTGDTLVTPKLVKSQEDFEASFGLFDKTNPLAKLWKQVFDAGCRSIYLIELRADTIADAYVQLHTVYSTLEDGFEADIVLLGGVYADTANPTGVVMVGQPREDFIATSGLGTRTSTTDTFTNGIITDLAISKPVVFSTVVVKKGETTLTLDTDYTIDKVAYKVILAVAPVITDIITITYMTYDYAFAPQLAGFCAETSNKYSQTIGVMAMVVDDTITSSDLASVKTYVEAQGKQIYNQYLQVVGGAPVYFEINREPYIDSVAGAYAGMISILASYSSPTNKMVPGAIFPVFNLSPTQISRLTNENHIVVPRPKLGGIVIADAITTAPTGSDFVRLTTLRITNDVVTLVREIGDPYIGEPNTLARRNALETAIRSSLNNMIKRGALNDFRFTIKSSVGDQIAGNMLIFLDIVPVFETRRINVTVALKPAL